MNEILFLVEEVPEGGYTARALGESIYTQADNIQQLHAAVRDSVHGHFDNSKPRIIRLYIVREEVIAL